MILNKEQKKLVISSAQADPAWEVCPNHHPDLVAEALLHVLSQRDRESLKKRSALDVVEVYEELLASI